MRPRKTFEQLAHTRTNRRIAKIEALVIEIGADWYDSEVDGICHAADRLGDAVRQFEAERAELWDAANEQGDA